MEFREGEFDLQRPRIRRLEEPAPENAVDLHRGSNNRVGLRIRSGSDGFGHAHTQNHHPCQSGMSGRQQKV
jgi:hypothetical protein